MDLQTGLQIEQRVQVTVTGRLLQSLHLLQTPGIELIQVLREELVRNPFLEEVSSAEEEAKQIDPDDVADSRQPSERSEQQTELPEFDLPASEETREFSVTGEVVHKTGKRETELWELNRLTASDSWQQELLNQLRLQQTNQAQIGIAEYLAGCLDQHGFLALPVSEIARLTGAEESAVETVRQKLMNLDPPGFGARDLKECLRVQVQRVYPDDTLSLRLIEEGLSELARRRWSMLAAKLDVTPASVKSAVKRIRTLWPYPKQMLTTVCSEAVHPDLMVNRVEDGFEVSVNDWRLPHIRFSPPGQTILCKRDETLQTFITEYVGKARWLLGSLAARQRTLIRLMRVIVDEQWEFFTKGKRFLKPLGYRRVADRMGFHESTIARAVQDKYVQTPRGVFPLRFFFTKALPATNGSAWTAVGVKMRISELIEGEKKTDPLSDDELTFALAREGIQLSRRTVAKYRDGMKLPRASFRREP